MYCSASVVTFSQMFNIKEYLVQKTKESSLFCGLTPSFHVIFHIIYFFTTNGDIKKNNWLQKFGKSARETSMVKFLSVKLQAYSLQTATLL